MTVCRKSRLVGRLVEVEEVTRYSDVQLLKRTRASFIFLQRTVRPH